ncbi:MAG: hypothetical protein ABIH86_01415 [Planctomycetota bacterium]
MLPIVHNVYTSVGGYKTVYVSPEAGAKGADLFDKFSNRVYKRLGKRAIRGIARYAGGASMHFKVFHYGSDHVGRPRTCAHLISVMPQHAANQPFFNPLLLDVDPLYMTGQTPMTGFAERFPKMIESPTMADAHRQLLSETVAHIIGSRPIDLPPANQIFSILAALVTPDAGIAIIGDETRAFDMLKRLSTLLPAGVFERFGIVMGNDISYKMPGVEPATVSVVPDATQLLAPRPVVLDLSARQLKGAITLDPWTEFLIRVLKAPNAVENILRCQWLLETHSGSTRPDLSALGAMVSALNQLGGLLSDRGAIKLLPFNVELSRAIPDVLNARLKPLAIKMFRAASETIRLKNNAADQPLIGALDSAAQDILPSYDPANDQDAIFKLIGLIERALTPVATTSGRIIAPPAVEIDEKALLFDFDAERLDLRGRIDASDVSWDVNKFDLETVDDELIVDDPLAELSFDSRDDEDITVSDIDAGTVAAARDDNDFQRPDGLNATKPPAAKRPPSPGPALERIDDSSSYDVDRPPTQFFTPGDIESLFKKTSAKPLPIPIHDDDDEFAVPLPLPDDDPSEPQRNVIPGSRPIDDGGETVMDAIRPDNDDDDSETQIDAIQPDDET